MPVQLDKAYENCNRHCSGTQVSSHGTWATIYNIRAKFQCCISYRRFFAQGMKTSQTSYFSFCFLVGSWFTYMIENMRLLSLKTLSLVWTVAGWFWKLEDNYCAVRKELGLYWQPRCYLCSSKFYGSAPPGCSRQCLCFWGTFTGNN